MLNWSIDSMFNTTFFMKMYGNYSTIEIDYMFPFELEIYYYMLIKHVRTTRNIQ